MVRLARDPEIFVEATTWQMTGHNGIGDRDAMRRSIDEQLNELLNDWLAVNPKKP